MRFVKKCLNAYGFRRERSPGFVFPGNVQSGGAYVPAQLPLVLTDNWNYPTATSLDAQPNWQGTGSSSAWLVQNQQFIYVNGGVIASSGDVVTTTTGLVETNKAHSIAWSGKVLVNCYEQITLDYNQVGEVTFRIVNNGAGATSANIQIIGGGTGSGANTEVDFPGSAGSMIITSAVATISAPAAGTNHRTATFTINVGGVNHTSTKDVGIPTSAALATIAIAWSNAVGGNTGLHVCEVNPITVRGYTS